MRFVAAFALVLSALICGVPAAAQPSGVRGDPAAIAAFEHLVNQMGGREAWRANVFSVEERGFMRSGDVAALRIERDFTQGARRLESTTPTRRSVEWVSPQGGWIEENGVRRVMPAEELAAELQGLQQEPYAIYHRFAHNDPALRVELRSNNTAIYVYDTGERLLCWFNIAGNGDLLGWGNFYDGAINQHYYGPVADMGDANLPRWGSASTGAFRFEYVSATLTNAPLQEPRPRR